MITEEKKVPTEAEQLLSQYKSVLPREILFKMKEIERDLIHNGIVIMECMEADFPEHANEYRDRNKKLRKKYNKLLKSVMLR